MNKSLHEGSFWFCLLAIPFGVVLCFAQLAGCTYGETDSLPVEAPPLVEEEPKPVYSTRSFRVLTAPEPFYAEDTATGRTVVLELPVGTVIVVPAVEAESTVDA